MYRVVYSPQAEKALERDFSLHCGQYRIPYLWDRESKTIIIEIVARHDEAYRKLKRYEA